MVTSVVPVTKALYLCDEVLGDPSNQKVHLLGVFNAVRPADEGAYPYHLPRLCVFAQLAGGVGMLPFRVDVVDAQDQSIVYTSPEWQVRFRNRHTTVSACFRVLDLPFPRPGVYIVELYAQNTFLDDRAFHLLG